MQHDDLVEFGKKNIEYPNSLVGLVFLSNQYSVTVDQGKSWKNSKVNGDPSCRITDVKLKDDASGLMTLSCNVGKR